MSLILALFSRLLSLSLIVALYWIDPIAAYPCLLCLFCVPSRFAPSTGVCWLGSPLPFSTQQVRAFSPSERERERERESTDIQAHTHTHKERERERERRERLRYSHPLHCSPAQSSTGSCMPRTTRTASTSTDERTACGAWCGLRERERERERRGVCVCARACVCVSVTERERERERAR